MTTQTSAVSVSSATRPLQQRLVGRIPALTGLMMMPGVLQICLSNGLAQSFGQRMQAIAVGWLVLEMSGSAFWLGIINGVPATSIVVFSLAGGVLADRLEPRRVLVASRSALSLAAVVIALLTMTGGVQLGYLLVYMLIVVGIAAIDMPVSRGLVLDSVGNSQLLSANAAQSALRDMFNIVVPLAMALLIGTSGSGAAFLILAVGYAVATLLMLRIRPREDSAVSARVVARRSGSSDTRTYSLAGARSHRRWSTIATRPLSSPPVADVLDGFVYIRTDPVVRALVLLGFLVPVAGIYFAMMPVYAREILSVGAGGLGALAASFSAGSLIGSLYLTARGGMSRRSSRLTLVGAAFGAGMMVFALSHSFALSFAVSFLMGVSAGIWLNLLTALVQLAAAPEMRGRVMGVSTMAYQLIGLGWLVGGTLASLLGVEATVLAGGIVFAGASIALFAMSEDMRKIN